VLATNQFQPPFQNPHLPPPPQIPLNTTKTMYTPLSLNNDRVPPTFRLGTIRHHDPILIDIQVAHRPTKRVCLNWYLDYGVWTSEGLCACIHVAEMVSTWRKERR
jgi:hypothetical protein